jgi:hypothetical protein
MVDAPCYIVCPFIPSPNILLVLYHAAHKLLLLIKLHDLWLLLLKNKDVTCMHRAHCGIAEFK